MEFASKEMRIKDKVKCRNCGKVIDLNRKLDPAFRDVEYNDQFEDGIVLFGESSLAYDRECECGWQYRVYLGVKLMGFEVFDDRSDRVKLEEIENKE